jgi:Spy/CpxP family protein refolding chaperone
MYSQAIQQFQLRQVAEKHRRKTKVEEREEMEAIRDIVRAKELDSQFEAYAGACMDEYREAGKDLRPLEVALRKATMPNTSSHTIK